MTSDKNGVVPAGQVQPAAPELLERIERRWDGLRERVEAKLLKIQGLDRRPERRLLDQAAKSGNATKRVMWLRKAADYVTDSAAPLAACRKGCSHCCHIAVMISRAEAQVIAKETGARLNTLAGKFSMANAEGDGDIFNAATREAIG